MVSRLSRSYFVQSVRSPSQLSRPRWDLVAFLNFLWWRGHQRPTTNPASSGDSSDTAEHLPVLESACRNCRLPLQVRLKSPFLPERRRSCLLRCCCAVLVALPLLLLSFSGDLKTDPGDAASCVTSAPWVKRMVCLGKHDYFFFPFSFSQINAEEVVQGLGFLRSKIKLAS